MKNNFVFIINSAISLPYKPLSYCKISSIYSPEERLQQTYQTIDSIRSGFPGTKIILIENSGKTDLLRELRERVDEYIYVGNNPLAKLATNSKWKGLSEATTLLLSRKKLIKKDDFIFKICGRYYLNDNFNLKDWDFNKFNFLCKENVYSTRYYGFPAGYLSYWYLTLLKTIPFLFLNHSIESLMRKFIDKKRVNYIKTLGIEGFIAPSGTFIKE